MSAHNLTPNQRAFCETRFRHPELTAAQCYLRAYPKCKSENAAAVEASRTLLPEHIARAIVGVKIIKTQSLKDPDLVRTEYHFKFADKSKALERLERILGMFEKEYQIKAPAEKKPDRWVWVPADRELTLMEWCEQVEELNQWEAEKKRQRAEMNGSSSKTAERGILQ